MGCSFFFHFDWSFAALLALSALLPIIARERRKIFFFRLLFGILISISAYAYTAFLYSSWDEREGTWEGKGYFKVKSVSPYHTPFKKGFLYKGTLLSFDGNEAIPPMKNLPCSLYYFGSSEKRYPADTDFLIEGQLLKREGNFYLKPALGCAWEKNENTFRFAEMRFLAKEKVRNFFSQKFERQNAAVFLSALITGDTFDRNLKFDFARLGLSHILAISGFHFAFLAAFAAFFLRLFLSEKKVLWILLILLNAYFLFLGSAPSVQRAWIIIQLYLLGKILLKRAYSFQLLGLAMLIEMILDPLVILNIGFQLSFLSCFGILLLYPFFSSLLGKILKKRTLLELQNFTFLSQHGYILLSFFRESLALSLAVNLTILPVLLGHFHKFPLFSLPYNLFFPFFVTLALALVLLGALTLFLPPLSNFILGIAEGWTAFLLKLTSFPCKMLEYSLHGTFSLSFLVIYLTLLMLMAASFFDRKGVFE